MTSSGKGATSSVRLDFDAAPAHLPGEGFSGRRSPDRPAVFVLATGGQRAAQRRIRRRPRPGCGARRSRGRISLAVADPALGELDEGRAATGVAELAKVRGRETRLLGGLLLADDAVEDRRFLERVVLRGMQLCSPMAVVCDRRTLSDYRTATTDNAGTTTDNGGELSGRSTVKIGSVRPFASGRLGIQRREGVSLIRATILYTGWLGCSNHDRNVVVRR